MRWDFVQHCFGSDNAYQIIVLCSFVSNISKPVFSSTLSIEERGWLVCSLFVHVSMWIWLW